MTKEIIPVSIYGTKTNKLQKLYKQKDVLESEISTITYDIQELKLTKISLFKTKRLEKLDKTLQKKELELEKLEKEIEFLNTESISKLDIKSKKNTKQYYLDLKPVLEYELLKAENQENKSIFPFTKKMIQMRIKSINKKINETDEYIKLFELKEDKLNKELNLNDTKAIESNLSIPDSVQNTENIDNKTQSTQSTKILPSSDIKQVSKESSNELLNKLKSTGITDIQTNENNLNIEDTAEFNTEALTKLEKIIGINTKILELLTKIKEDAIDEQNTDIIPRAEVTGTNSTEMIIEPTERDEEKSALQKLLSLLGLALAKLFGNGILSFLKGIGKLAINGLLKMAKWIGTLGTDLVKGISTHVWNSLKNLGSVIKDIWGFVSSKVGDVVGKMKTKLLKFLEPYIDLAKNFKNKVIEISKGLISKTKKTFQKAISKVTALASKAKDLAIKASSAVKSVLNSAKDKVTELASKAKDKAMNVTSKVKDKVGSWLTKSKGFISSGIDTVKDKVSKAKEYTKKLASKAKDFLIKITSKKINKLLGSKVTKILVSSAKKFGKAIPGVGALMGVGFAIKEAMSGNYKKATLALASGLVSTIPVVGVPLSIALEYAGSKYIDDKELKHKKVSVNKKNIKNVNKDISKQNEVINIKHNNKIIPINKEQLIKLKEIHAKGNNKDLLLYLDKLEKNQIEQKKDIEEIKNKKEPIVQSTKDKKEQEDSSTIDKMYIYITDTKKIPNINHNINNINNIPENMESMSVFELFGSEYK